MEEKWSERLADTLKEEDKVSGVDALSMTDSVHVNGACDNVPSNCRNQLNAQGLRVFRSKQHSDWQGRS